MALGQSRSLGGMLRPRALLWVVEGLARYSLSHLPQIELDSEVSSKNWVTEMSELDLYVTSGLGRWAAEKQHQSLGQGIWEYETDSGAIRIFELGIQHVDFATGSVTDIDLHNVDKIVSSLTIERLSEASRRNDNSILVAMDFISSATSIRIFVPIVVYSGVLIALMNLKRDAR